MHIKGKTNKQTKSAQISPYLKLTQATGPTLGGQKPKGRKTSTFQPEKRDLKHDILKIIIITMKRQRNTTQMKEQIRNTEVQLNEE